MKADNIFKMKAPCSKKKIKAMQAIFHMVTGAFLMDLIFIVTYILPRPAANNEFYGVPAIDICYGIGGVLFAMVLCVSHFMPCFALSVEEKDEIANYLDGKNDVNEETRLQIMNYCASVMEMGREFFDPDKETITEWAANENKRVVEARLKKLVEPGYQQKVLGSRIKEGHDAEMPSVKF